MKYREALQESMRMLACDKRVRFIGYNVKFGIRAYGTLKGVPENRIIETPLAENLMTGLAMGMSLEGYKPVLFFERHDFLLNALDAIVNHLDKIERMSRGEYKAPVIIRAVVGGKNPIDPGLQHTQEYTEAIRKMVSFPVINLRNTKEIIPVYEKVFKMDSPVMIVERREFFENE